MGPTGTFIKSITYRRVCFYHRLTFFFVCVTGSGKTTLLNVLARRVKSGVTGEINVNGHPISKDFRKHIAYVLQDDVLFSHLTVEETLRFQALLRQPYHLSEEEKFEKVNLSLPLNA